MTQPTKREKETGLSQHWANPFEQMDQWLHELCLKTGCTLSGDHGQKCLVSNPYLKET